jgi:hypothetical protein
MDIVDARLLDINNVLYDFFVVEMIKKGLVMTLFGVQGSETNIDNYIEILR